MKLDPAPHPYVNEYVKWPKELTLYFSGDTICSIPVWSWALMDATDLYASDRGHETVKTEKTNIWAATVALGRGLAFLHERKWTGKLTIKSHVRDCGIFRLNSASRHEPLMKRCLELLANIKRYGTEPITGDENEFARSLASEAYREYGTCK